MAVAQCTDAIVSRAAGIRVCNRARARPPRLRDEPSPPGAHPALAALPPPESPAPTARSWTIRHSSRRQRRGARRTGIQKRPTKPRNHAAQQLPWPTALHRDQQNTTLRQGGMGTSTDLWRKVPSAAARRGDWPAPPPRRQRSLGATAPFFSVHLSPPRPVAAPPLPPSPLSLGGPPAPVTIRSGGGRGLARPHGARGVHRRAGPPAEGGEGEATRSAHLPPPPRPRLRPGPAMSRLTCSRGPGTRSGGWV